MGIDMEEQGIRIRKGFTMSDVRTSQRTCTRAKVNISVELRVKGTVKFQGVVENISLQGVFVRCLTQVSLGAPCEVLIFADELPYQALIHADGTVVRADPEGLAIHFRTVFGENSLEHLKKLVLYNSGSESQQIEQELTQHLGIKSLT